MASDELVSFGDLLRRKRRAAGLTHEELAERAGLSVRGISDLERGVVRAPRRDTLDLLAEALDLSDDERRDWESLRRNSSARGGKPGSQAPPARPAGNLPTPLTSLIGRARDISEVASRLEVMGERLVSVTGPGGVGKTRLAIEVGRQLQGAFPDGAWFVDLAPLNDPDLVIPTIASTLGLVVTGMKSPQTALTEALWESSRLLVLDNYEHVVGSAPAIVRLLAECPGLLILTTSRVALRVQGEWEYALGPLALPDTSSDGDDANLAANESVALFTQRARAVRSDFSISKSNARAVAEICRRLDGLPLALELAAARIRLLPAQAMLERMEPLLPMLTSGARDLPDRQRTLRATIEWSYELLDPEVQALLRLLSAFRGGWTLEAAEAVVDPSINVLDGLQALIEHSLVHAENLPDGTVRYTMLETVREFCLECLGVRQESDRIHRRHAAFFADFVDRVGAYVIGPGQRSWYDQLRAEFPNIRAALGWSIASKDSAISVRLAVGLHDFWYWHGHLQEGRRWIEAALVLADGVSPDLQARAYQSLGTLAVEQGDMTAAEEFIGKALEYFREVQDASELADTLKIAGGMEMYRGDYARATRFYDESLCVARVAGDKYRIAQALGSLSIMATVSDDYSSADALAAESLSIFRELGDERGVTRILGYQGHFALWRGDVARASEFAHECLTRISELGDFAWRAFTLDLLGYIELEREDYHRSFEYFSEGLRGHYELRELMSTAFSLEGLAGVAAESRSPVRAAQLLGRAAALRDQIHSPVPPPRQARYDRTVAVIREQLDAEAFAVAFAQGREMSLDRAVALAVQPLEALP